MIINDVDINETECMNLIYSKDLDDLRKIACLIVSKKIRVEKFLEGLTDNLKLTFKQNNLLKFKIIKIFDIVLDIFDENELTDDLNLEIEDKLLN